MNMKQESATLTNGSTLEVITHHLMEPEVEVKFVLLCFPLERILSIKRIHGGKVLIDDIVDLSYFNLDSSGVPYSNVYYGIGTFDACNNFIKQQRKIMIESLKSKLYLKHQDE